MEEAKQLIDDLNEIEALASMGSWEMNEAGEDVYWSEGFFKLHGLSPKEIGISREQRMTMVHPDDRDALQEAFNAAYYEGKAYSLEKRIVLPDGSIKWVLSKGALKSQGGKRSLRGVMIDIHAHKMLELEKLELESHLHLMKNEELQRAFNAFQAAVSKSSIVSRANKSGIITDVNDNFIKISGFSREELIGQNHRIINSAYHSKSFWVAMWRTIVKGEIWRGEVRNRAKNGTYYWVDTFIIPFLDDRGKVQEFLSIRNDITSRKETEVALQASQLRAEKANQAKSEFLANMSHEIRTPLNGVIGFTDLLSKTDLTETQLQYVGLIHQSADNLLDIVNNVLDLSKIEAGKLELDPESTDLEALCRQLMEMIGIMAKWKDIHLVYTYSEALPRYVRVDPFRIKQILLNLLANAVKFTEKGSIELHVMPSANITKQPVRGCVDFHFSVRDTGIGIRKENFEKIFETFSQEDSSVTKKYGGTGLGLSICNQLLRLMNSQLGVESTLNEGSTFSFDICLEPANEEIAFIKQPKDTVANGNLPVFANKAISILVVEDNAINRILVKVIIRNLSADIQIIEAENGAIAIEKFASAQPDLILMDIQMPEMNGYEATERIRQMESERGSGRVPIIALTAAALVGEREKCFEAGMDDFVTKPIANNAIEQLFEKWLWSAERG